MWLLGWYWKWFWVYPNFLHQSGLPTNHWTFLSKMSFLATFITVFLLWTGSRVVLPHWKSAGGSGGICLSWRIGSLIIIVLRSRVMLFFPELISFNFSMMLLRDLCSCNSTWYLFMHFIFIHPLRFLLNLHSKVLMKQPINCLAFSAPLDSEKGQIRTIYWILIHTPKPFESPTSSLKFLPLILLIH